MHQNAPLPDKNKFLVREHSPSQQGRDILPIPRFSHHRGSAFTFLFIYHSKTEWVSRVWHPTRNIIGRFGDKETEMHEYESVSVFEIPDRRCDEAINNNRNVQTNNKTHHQRQTYEFKGWVGRKRSSLQRNRYFVITNGDNNSCNSTKWWLSNYVTIRQAQTY